MLNPLDARSMPPTRQFGGLPRSLVRNAGDIASRMDLHRWEGHPHHLLCGVRNEMHTQLEHITIGQIQCKRWPNKDRQAIFQLATYETLVIPTFR